MQLFSIVVLKHLMLAKGHNQWYNLRCLMFHVFQHQTSLPRQPHWGSSSLSLSSRLTQDPLSWSSHLEAFYAASVFITYGTPSPLSCDAKCRICSIGGLPCKASTDKQFVFQPSLESLMPPLYFFLFHWKASSMHSSQDPVSSSILMVLVDSNNRIVSWEGCLSNVLGELKLSGHVHDHIPVLCQVQKSSSCFCWCAYPVLMKLRVQSCSSWKLHYRYSLQ